LAIPTRAQSPNPGYSHPGDEIGAQGVKKELKNARLTPAFLRDLHTNVAPLLHYEKSLSGQ